MSFVKGFEKVAVSVDWANKKAISGLMTRAKVNPQSVFAKQLKTHISSESAKDLKVRHMPLAERNNIHRTGALSKHNPNYATKALEQIADKVRVGKF